MYFSMNKWSSHACKLYSNRGGFKFWSKWSTNCFRYSCAPQEGHNLTIFVIYMYLLPHPLAPAYFDPHPAHVHGTSYLSCMSDRSESKFNFYSNLTWYCVWILTYFERDTETSGFSEEYLKVCFTSRSMESCRQK